MRVGFIGLVRRSDVIEIWGCLPSKKLISFDHSGSDCRTDDVTPDLLVNLHRILLDVPKIDVKTPGLTVAQD